MTWNDHIYGAETNISGLVLGLVGNGIDASGASAAALGPHVNSSIRHHLNIIEPFPTSVL